MSDEQRFHNSLDPDPFRVFRQWLQEAEQAGNAQPYAMTLATSSSNNIPSARIVLLRGSDERGFVFFTSYDSLKGQHLEENPCAALLFYWPELSRQIRIEGAVAQLDGDTSDRYFAGRPRGHQLEAHASPQSRVISGRAELVERFAAVAQRFARKDVPRPRNWGGYRVVPESFEFWREGDNRLHDRRRYRRDKENRWVMETLAP
ncbi:MAG: pyridoxamine 5'-phosphate oxidase [Desulfuromonadales bacterium]|nr:pyridoxamine 5'-phosphate oxidase [Desulfuromonadales bacterium]